MSFDSLPGLWREIFRLPVPARIRQFRDPAIRARLARDAESTPDDDALKFVARLEGHRVIEARNPQTKPLEGRSVGEIANERGCRAIDAMLDVAVADGLETVFAPDVGGDDRAAWALRGQIWRDDRTLVGASDAGAHLDLIDTFAFSTTLIERGVRDHGVISLEEAVYQLTDRPARYFGLIDRGRVAPGYFADMVLFDERAIARGPIYRRADMPGGAARVYADAIGVSHVFVNGVRIVRDGVHTGARPGTVLRSGRDTRTVAMAELQERHRAPERPADHR